MATLYIDNTNSTGNLTGTDWTFTNASTAVSSAGAGDAVNDGLVAGDYIRPNGGTQWYKVATVTDADNLVITPAFQQATIAGTATINWQDVSVKNGTSIANAWVHPALYTTVTVRTAGDIGKMRTNQTHVMAGIDLLFDENGTAAAMIQLKGCDSVDDPWTDASDVHVTFDFSNTAFNVNLGYNLFKWYFENIDIIQSGDINGGLWGNPAQGIKFIDCVFRNNINEGCYFRYTSSVYFEDCSFLNNGGSDITSDNRIHCKRCTFDGASGNRIDATVFGLFEDCTFGSTTPATNTFVFDTSGGMGRIECRRCKFDDTNITVNLSVANASSIMGNYFKSEDHNQIEGASYSEYWNAKIEKETTEVRGGGATSSIKVKPNANCVANFPIEVMEWEEQAVPAAQQTRGVCIKQGLADPTGFPTNTQLYLEAEYYNHATNDTVAKAVSTAVLSVYNTWTWFPVVFTPAQVQKVRYRVYLGIKKSAEAYYIDNQLYDADPI